LGTNYITYETRGGGFAQNFLDKIVNHTPDNEIVLWGVDSTFHLDDGTPITSVFGWTDWRRLPEIHIFLDVSGSGMRYCACAAGKNPTSMPPFVMLAHELSHALHAINGTLNLSNPEPQAIADENAIRTQRGVLPLRDPTLYGNPTCEGLGTCTPPPPTPPAPPPPPPDCFVASAAYGSPLAIKVQMFRRLRDAFLRRSIIGNAFFANFYAEYNGFSRLVVADMRASQELKINVSKVVVDPLLSFFTIFHLYVRGGWKRIDFWIEVESLLRNDLGELERSVIGFELNRVHSAVVQICEHLSHRAYATSLPRLPAVLRADSDPISVLTYLADKVVVGAASTEYLTWAVFRPLTMYWSILVEITADRMSGKELGRYLGTLLEDWLAAFPIPSEFRGLSEETAHVDLAMLAETVFTIPAVRQRVGERLLNAFMTKVPYDLRSLLRSVGYGGS